ncbi:MAG: sodium:solute symporter, partial [Alphaproteobacteria bacterium]|nr:sodium:solute symporter [Alphaproteobacteria bacterium]
LVFIGWWYLLRKMVRIGRTHRISSIADLISSRFGKSNTLAVLVTLLAVLGTTPYIALQLKAVTSSFQIVSNAHPEALLGISAGEGEAVPAFWLAVGLAVFTILFGTRNIDANERHPGVVAAIAFEALVKLVALLAVGVFVVFAIGGGLPEVFSSPEARAVLAREDPFGSRWLTLTFLAAAAIICLPRQFQITVVENANERHLATASWLFPAYLVLMCLFTLPIAIVGLGHLPDGANPDMFVLTLPMAAGADWLALLTFIGGFSSATSMVIVASIALSIMISNHIVMPLALRLPRHRVDESGDVRSLLLNARRVAIGMVMLLGFLYYQVTANQPALAAMGLIAFAGVAQFLPAIVIGLYWRGATAKGAVAGLSAGFLVWAYTLLLPNFAVHGNWVADLVADGPFGLVWLRPNALLGLSHLDPLVHAVYWSLSANVALLVGVSLFSQRAPLERLQSALFVDVFRNPAQHESRALVRTAAIDDLFVLTQRILGADEALRLFQAAARRQGVPGNLPRPDAAFIGALERQLAGSIGAASARVMIGQVASGETISMNEIVRMIDETQQVIEYSHELEVKSRELERTAAQLRAANLRLRQLDHEKDDFLSQVSHELRTPMTSIRSFSDVLINADDIPPAQAKRFLTIIQEESLRLTRLLDEILDLSHLEKGERALELEALNPEDAVGRALAACEGLARQLRVNVDHLPGAGDVQVRAHIDRLEQVLVNLIANAIKYNTNPNPLVVVSSQIEGTEYRVLVEDNGPGIAEADRPKLFTKFARGWQRVEQGRAGAGLGLAISWEIMKQFDGRLELLRSSERGSTFAIALPLHAPATSSPTA